MSWHVLVNGEPASAVPVSDRGLLYGDGVFETVLVARGHPVLWREHLARLAEGCRRLGLESSDPGVLAEELAAVSSGRDRCVVRLTLTRGEGARGYRPEATRNTRIVAAYPAPEVAETAYLEGIAVRCCSTRLARQPRLAGIKHLNRLEQVLARAEWSDPHIAEGLMCDAGGLLIGATAANLFLVGAERVQTPRLDQAGVAGTCRAWIMQATDCIERELTLTDLERASEVFLASSVRGILPVVRIDDRGYHPGPVTRALMNALHRHEPMLQPAPRG
jgi:4-amino-4-deoxychorismate lyase